MVVLRRALAAVLLLFSASCVPAQTLALTFDDGLDPSAEPAAASWNRQILKSLRDAGISSMVFPSLVRTGRGEGLDLIGDWGRAGHAIGNHTSRHRSLGSPQVPLADFIGDVKEAGAVLSRIPGWSKMLRFPYLKEGNTLAKRDGMRLWMQAAGYRAAPVSIDASDWYYNQVYVAGQRGPSLSTSTTPICIRKAQRQTEETIFAPTGRKGRVRALMAEMQRGDIPVAIARAPEFYGPGKTQSVTNTLVIEPLKAGRKAKVPVRDDTLRTLIWTPDASRAMALIGNTEDAYGQTWLLPCWDERLTYQAFVHLAATTFGVAPRYRVLSHWALVAASWVSKPVRELRELLPRYAHDLDFDSSKFRRRFPHFVVTSYEQGLRHIAQASS